MTDTRDTVDATILEWHARGVGPGGISNALEAMGMGKWTAKDVGAALKRLGIVRTAEAVGDPGRRPGVALEGG